VIAILVVGFLTMDVPDSRMATADGHEHILLPARAVKVNGELKARYRHPLTHQIVSAPLEVDSGHLTPKPGQSIHVIAERDDPLYVTLAGDKWPVTRDAPSYAGALVAVLLPVLYRRWNVRRAERLAAGNATTFAMNASLFRERFGRTHLALYALDGAVGSPPVCVLRVLTTALAPQTGCLFDVEVKGNPRPFGRVVVAYRNGVLWPSGPALGLRRRRPRPESIATEPGRLRSINRSLLKWAVSPLPFMSVIGTLMLGSIAFVGVVTAVTLHNAEALDRLSRHGTERVATIVRHAGENDDILVLEYGPEGHRKLTSAGVDFASDYPVGIRYPIRVDPTRPSRARLETEPYNKAEPIEWAVLPLLVFFPWFGHRAFAWRRFARAAKRGPWHRADATVVGWSGRGSLLAILAGEECVAALPIAKGDRLPKERFELTLAGDLDAGSAIAAWWKTSPIVPRGFATIAEARLPAFKPVELGDTIVSTEPRSIVLKSFRWLPRTPTMTIVGHEVTMSIGKYFTAPWVFDARDVAAVDDTRAVGGKFDADIGVVVPVLRTTGNVGTPTLILLFKTPQRVPPLRRFNSVELPWTYRRSRSADGERADGIQLRAADPRAAVVSLAAAGAAVPERPLEWLRSVRPELWASQRRAAVKQQRRRSTVLTGVATAVLIAGFGPMMLLSDASSSLLFGVLMAVGSSGMVLLYVAGRVRKGSPP
jgi:hypothetical protein